jgi:uncharacterized membrane protein
MITFTVLEFSRAEGAEYMVRTLRQLQEQHLIQIEDWAIVTWPLGAKHPRTKQLNQMNGNQALAGTFWGMLFGLLFSAPFFGVTADNAIDALISHFTHYGIDEAFIKGVRNQITEGTSALFLLTSGAVLDQVVAAIKKGMQFELISTDLSKEQEDLLHEAFSE